MHFHIYSNTGKKVNDFLGVKSEIEKQEKKTVLFASGCEFMVCDRSTDASGVTHIYVREIILGLSNPIIWLDDNKNSIVFKRIHECIQKQSQDVHLMSLQFVMKTNSIVCQAYFQSVYFRIAT